MREIFSFSQGRAEEYEDGEVHEDDLVVVETLRRLFDLHGIDLPSQLKQ